jgi:hypothetical protein
MSPEGNSDLFMRGFFLFDKAVEIQTEAASLDWPFRAAGPGPLLASSPVPFSICPRLTKARRHDNL